MRTPLIMLPVVAALVALGCTDGPNDPYQPGPADAGWNSGNATSNTDGGQDYDAGYPTTGKNVPCSTDLKRQRWAWMLTQPIVPPRKYAGIDMAKNDNWDGLKIDDAEQAPATPDQVGGGLCQSVPLGNSGPCPSGFGGCNTNYWGNNYEVIFTWNVATHLVDQMELQLGYTGALETTTPYPDHNGQMHTWKVSVGDIIRRDGLAFQIGWGDTATFQQQTTDIFNAVMANYAPQAGVPFNQNTCNADSDCASATQVLTCQCDHGSNTDGTCVSAGKCGFKNCATDGNCLNRNDGLNTYMGFRPLVVYIVGTSGVPQPALSTPNLIYNFFSKWEPYSNLPQVVKLDANGPNATGTPIGAKDPGTVCVQEVGQTYDDFVKNCVQVTGDPPTDNTNLTKVTHSLTHDTEHWTANVLGVNQNFTSHKVLQDPTAVVLDSDMPSSGDVAQDWTFDSRARGVVRNDYTGYQIPNFRGSALLMMEWARLMLEDIGTITGHTYLLGDPACTGYDSSGTPNYELNPGCSGIEGMMIPYTGYDNDGSGTTPSDFSGDPSPLAELQYASNNWDYGNVYFASILKPGDLSGAFCVDPGSMVDCTADGVSIWQNALKHVIRVLGNGDVLNLPTELQDRRYYFKWFGVAYVKYLKAYGEYNTAHPATVDNFPDGTAGSGLSPSDVAAQKLDLESLFFDFSVTPGTGGAQTFDKFEYIDREYIGQGVGGADNYIPWDFEYGCDIFGGNQRYDNWFRRMDREEIALYSAMLEDKDHTPGQENNVNITNLFGSSILAGNWPSYACATGQSGDPSIDDCGGTNPPLDPVQSHPLVGGDCSAYTGEVPAGGNSYENGYVTGCGVQCDFTKFPASGCAENYKACIGGTACLDLKMDKNGHASYAKPLLAGYPGAWSRSPFSAGHSPVTIAAADKKPNLGVAMVHIPNFAQGPYTYSPIQSLTPNCTTDADCDQSQGSTCNTTTGFCSATCPTGYNLSSNKAWCNADTFNGTGTRAPEHAGLAPWLEVQPGVGFPIPLDAQHNQWVSTGQIDFTGVLEQYIVDYLPWTDPAKPSCISDGACRQGYSCDKNSHSCVTDDNTIQVAAIEGADFLGQAFVCQDPWTGDILHVGMFDSALGILDWLAAHPGASTALYGVVPSAQDACQILVIRSPADNYVDYIVAKGTGVTLNIGDGQGQGRVVDVVLWDPGLIQNL